MKANGAFAVAMAALGLMATGCGRSVAPANKPGAAPSTPAVIFDSGQGTGPYDQMTYAKYVSEVVFTPSMTHRVRSIRPRIWYSNGSSGFIAFLRDEHGGWLGA